MSLDMGNTEQQTNEEGSGVMTVEINKEIVRRALDQVFNVGSIEAVERLYAPDFVNHIAPSMGSEIRGIEGVKANVVLWRTAFPDLRVTLDAEIAERDLVVSRWTAQGTHRGPLRGIPPSGRVITLSAIEISRVAGHRIAEQWLVWDTLDLLHQISGMDQHRPAPAETPQVLTSGQALNESETR
jgi:steroid delta-isomerase-like uncharacterized protein